MQVIPNRILPNEREAMAWTMPEFKSSVGKTYKNLCTRMGYIGQSGIHTIKNRG